MMNVQKMTIGRARILFLGVLCIAGFCVNVTAQEAKRPNIILIMADDLGFECLGTYGSASYKTPRLDAMAEQGILFTHAYAQPLCTPSRVQIMTGRYNHRNYKQFGVLPPEEITFGHMLQKAGYKTCIAGKWQLYGFDTRQFKSGGIGSLPGDAGFDAYCLWQVTQPKKMGERYADPRIQLTGKEAETFKDQYGPNINCDFIMDFMETHRDEPFFVYFPMSLVHDPFVPTPDVPDWDGDRYAKDNKHFADMVNYMDTVVGRIVDKVDALGLSDNTLIVFTGDNGTNRSIVSLMKDGRKIPGDKGQSTEYGTHVPLIAYWPGMTPQGVICDDLIDFSDFVPTVVDLAGAKLPDDRVIDGRSFVPQLRGETGNPRSWVFCHYDPNWGDRKRARFARDKRWKLFDDGRFIDVLQDPFEQHPISENDLPTDAQQARTKLQHVLDTMAAEEKVR